LLKALDLLINENNAKRSKFAASDCFKISMSLKTRLASTFVIQSIIATAQGLFS